MGQSFPEKYDISLSGPGDLERIFSLFSQAITYQKQNGYEVWPQFSSQLIETEIQEGRHWKITAGDKLVCVFSVLYSDPFIWKEKNMDPSVYLHRIAINPLFKGQKMMIRVKEWALGHALKKKKKYVRMDTWGMNENLRNYYVHCGFNYIGQCYLDQIEGQSLHYGGPILSLFQLEA